jgi:dynein heavy chain, axonemal
MSRNEASWKRWFDENEPERCPVPDYEERIVMERTVGYFIRFVLVRSLREDRTGVACAQFVENQLGKRFTDPVADQVADIYDESDCRKPVLYLLTAGSDPTATIQDLAKKKKKFPTDNVSMGEGQEVVAWEKMKNGFLAGNRNFKIQGERLNNAFQKKRIDSIFQNGRMYFCVNIQLNINESLI